MKKRVDSILVFLLLLIRGGFSMGGDATVEPGLSDRSDLVFYGGFEDNYNNSDWESEWGVQWDNRASENEVVSDFKGGNSLRVTYPAGGVGPGESGTQFPMCFRDMEGLSQDYFQELYLRYYLKFEEGFDYGGSSKGGKLPGLMGGGNSWSRSGGDQPDGTNGWTLRFMWRDEGKIVIYAYVPPSDNGKWGSETWGQDIMCGFTAEPGTWHCIEQYVNVGTPGSDDGQLKVWIDGIQRLNIDDMRFWDEENDYGRIGGIYVSTFHGGSGDEWAPSVDSYTRFDGFAAATSRVGLYGEDPSRLSLNDMSLSEGYVGLPYNDELTSVSGGSSPYTWSVESGSLPEGISLSETGELTGVPQSAGTNTLVFRVQDSEGDTALGEGEIVISSSDGINLANGQTYYADSDNLDPANPVEGHWDGDISGDPAGSPGGGDIDSYWVEYDLGSACNITQIRLHGDADGKWYSTLYSVKIKNNQDDSWETLIDNRDCYGNEWYETDTDVSARFIRLEVTGNTTDHATQIREFEVYGDFVSSIKGDGSSLISDSPVRVSLRKNSIMIKGYEHTDISAELFDHSGRRVKKEVFPPGADKEISLNGVSTGAYLILIKDSEGILRKSGLFIP